MTTNSDAECSYIANLADVNVIIVIIIVILIKIIVIITFDVTTSFCIFEGPSQIYEITYLQYPNIVIFKQL